MAIVQLFARPTLRDRLVMLNGTSRGYLEFVVERLTVVGGKAVSEPMVSKVLAATKPAPMWMVVGLTRIAEDNLELGRDNAYALSSEWFTTEKEAAE